MVLVETLEDVAVARAIDCIDDAVDVVLARWLYLALPRQLMPSVALYITRNPHKYSIPLSQILKLNSLSQLAYQEQKSLWLRLGSSKPPHPAL
jgi:hypothetical protein